MKIELKSEELEETFKEDKSKEVVGDQTPAVEPALPVEKEEDVLQPYYEYLTPTKIEAFRIIETVHVQNKYLTREKYSIARAHHCPPERHPQIGVCFEPEGQDRYPIITTTFFITKEDLSSWYGHSPWLVPSLGEVSRYRITITSLPLSFFLVRPFWLYLGLVE